VAAFLDWNTQKKMEKNENEENAGQPSGKNKKIILTNHACIT